ncbi:MAG: sulfatase [Candidatus Omnitrophica bacterium]|nr:sulfatase [Candidatus Omnitrophota bacterium]
MNIVFVLCDALRPDHLGCYGYQKGTSPFIDKLAGEGVLFLNTVSNCNHTLPGLISAFTGLYQTTHKIDGPANFQRWGSLWQGEKTPFMQLRDNGYVVGGQDPEIYKHLGFDVEVKDIAVSVETHKNSRFFLWYRPETTHLPYNPPPPYDTLFMPAGYEISDTTREKLNLVKNKLIIHRPGFVSRLENGEDDPISKPGYERTYGITTFTEEERPAVVALYDGEVRSLDDEIKRYADKLERLNLLDETIFIITSDHGEQLLERGALGHSSCSMEGTLYDENIKIPLIIRCPRLLPQGRIIKKQVSQVDIMPTIFDMLGLAIQGTVDGKSLLPLIREERTDFHEVAYAMTQPCGWQLMKGDDRMLYCLRTPDWKLIRFNDPRSSVSEDYRLYNLQNDPGEEVNLASENPQITERLKKKLELWINGGKTL